MYAIVGEDDVCLALAVALVKQSGIQAQIQMANAAGGFGPFREKIEKMNVVARNIMPVLMLADGDQDACPVRQINTWRPRHQAPRLQLRLAVREAESWLLADHKAFSSFLGISDAIVPRAPDTVRDSKTALLQLVARSRNRLLRDEMLRDGTLKPGLGYNAHLLTFIEDLWSVDRAAERSPSAQRAVRRINQLFSP